MSTVVRQLWSQLQDLSPEEKRKYGIIAAVSLLGLYSIKTIKDNWGLPPGPKGIPILGSLPSIDTTQLHKYCFSVSSKYGPLSSFYLGQNLVILVADYDMAKELFNKPEMSGRLQNEFVKSLTQKCGIVTTDGPEWSNQRRLVLQILRDFGFAKTFSQDLVTQETYHLEDELKNYSRQKKGIRVADVMLNHTNSIVAKLTYAIDLTDKDPEFDDVVQRFKKFTSDSILVTPPLLFPSLGNSKFIKFLPAVRDLLENMNAIHSYGFKKIKERKDLLSKEDADPQCVADSYILEQRKAEAKGDTYTFRDFQLMRICTELFLAGTDTTARSIEWVLLFMAINPGMQKKMHAEIISVIGESGRIQMKDKTQMNYTQAVIEEAYRFASLASVGIFHRATETIYYNGYKIPQNATLLPFIYGIHHNPKNFSNPEEFRPERFIDKEGAFKPDPKVIPFSVGKRSCLGESLARMEVFMFSVFIVQHFKVELHPDYKSNVDEILRGTMGLLFAANEHLLTFEER